MLQVISKNKVAFSYKGQSIRWEKGVLYENASLYYAEPKWNWFLECDFTDFQEKDRQMVQLSVKSGDNKGFIQLKEGFPYYSERSGKRIHYLELNYIQKEVFLPTSLYQAIKKAGVNLPSYLKSF